ncbi:kelch domain-containing protein [Ophiostoma piceae UAMH 11346]|uniref:Kelch domain-containing protein n=1 Tax=Ophiostoma piceae (strain UAMH 11346) TaxID=1262450 RepID=S3D4K6_OPHP1|nr:kelch domain-containing protein [Ophiostoma piceae UAMH 11346]
MEHFTQLKRRTTDLLQSLPENLPSPTKVKFGNVWPSSPTVDKNTLKGTWQRISLPPLPRSSHTINVVSGTAYIFGGEGVSSRHPIDNSMHAIVLPTGSAEADYHVIKAVAAKKTPVPEAPILTISEPPPDSDPVAIAEPETVAEDGAAQDKGKGKEEDVVEEIPLPGAPLGDVPEPRVGHATAVIGSRIFLFGGRGGPDMVPLEERGRVWVFDTKSNSWSFLDPLAPVVPVPLQAIPETAGTATVVSQTNVPGASGVSRPIFPIARSYHAATSSESPTEVDESGGRPRATSWKQWAEGDMARVGTPQRPIVGNIAARARDADSDGYGTFIIHGGCLLGGGRANDVWAFDVRTRVWQELPSAPGLPRGGTSIALSRNRLYRFGGFNGSSEEGGRLDFLQLELSSLEDTSVEGATPTIGARGVWQSIVPETRQSTTQVKAIGEADTPASSEAAPSSPITAIGAEPDWPGDRSVSSLESITTGGGWEYLVLALGERTPSGSGHEAAGTFWSDVWTFQVPSDNFSAASVSNAVRNVLPRRLFGGASGAGEGHWSRVVTAPYDEEDDTADEGEEFGPGARGWFSSSPMRELEENGIVIFGGLNEKNQRLGDGWIFRLGGETRE